MKSFQPHEFEYLQISGHPVGEFSRLDLYDDAFQFWHQYWSNTLDEVSPGCEKPSADDFFRQDYVTVLRHRGQIIALHAYSFFNLSLKPVIYHSYFKKYGTQDFFARLQELNAWRVMTMEYLSVAKSWSFIRTGVWFAKILAVLGLKVAAEAKVDGTITAARADVPAVSLARQIGGVSLVKDIEIYGKPSHLMFFSAESSPLSSSRSDQQIKFWVDALWAQKQIFLGNPMPEIIAEPHYDVSA